MSVLAPLHPPTWVLATLCGFLVALAASGDGRARLFWLLPAVLLQGLIWDVSSQPHLIVVTLLALCTRPLFARKGWLVLCLGTLTLQAALSLTLRPDTSACRPLAPMDYPILGSPHHWGSFEGVALDTLDVRIGSEVEFPPVDRTVVTREGPLDRPVRDVGHATLVARPDADELVLTLAPRARPSRKDRITRSIRIPVEQGLKQVQVELDLAEFLAGNLHDDAQIGSVELDGGEIIELELRGRNWRFQGPGGVDVIEHEGVLRPSIWLRAGATTSLSLPGSEGELRFTPGSIGEAVPVVRREGEVLHLSVEGEGIGLFGDPRLVWPQPDPPLVLLYMVDTLRADRATTPNLTALAEEGLVFSQAWSTSAWTKPAIPTLMSGLEPSTHRVGAGGVGDRLPESVVTIQDRFRESGWRTGSFSASPLGSTLSGLEQGFGTVLPPRYWGATPGREHPTAAQLHEALLSWLAEESDQPAFAYVHAMDVHEYEERRTLFSTVGDYEDAVSEWDAELGRLLQAIDRPLLLAVLSDHGESFWDHGVARHGTGLWASQTHIPWIVWGSGEIGRAHV